MKKINLLIVRVLLIFMLPLGAWEFPCSGAAETGHSGQPSGANTQYLSLTPQTKILLGKNAPVPVKTAVNHLQRDIARVLGDSLEVLASMPAGQEKPLIVISFPGAGIRSGNAISGWEAHQVIVDMHKGGQHVFLEGADTRGTVYAIYSFAEKFLDVPPLWFWALYEPERATAIRVPETTRIRFSSPSVKYRTFFPNDDQLLEALLEREPAHRDRVFETMMRLKLNCYETGSLEKYPEGGKNNESLLNARIANKHGMVITTHHVYPVGASLGDWEAYWQFKGHTRAPALDVTNLDPLESFYRDHIRGILEEGFDMLWTVGFRGVGDRPWFTAFDHVEASDSLFGAVIEKMIHTQIHLLEEEAGTGVMMRSQFYNEGADLFAGGHIHLPVEKENLIWSFDDVSSSRVPQPYMLEYTYAPHQKLGYYFHFQHSRTGSHFVQGVGPWKMEQNYRMVNALTQAPLAFSVVNSGNIREFVMEISSNAAMMWDLEDYDSGRFLRNFCSRYYGARHATYIAGLYREFYDAYWETKEPDLKGMDRQYVFNDYRHIRAMQSLLLLLPEGYTSFPLIWEAGDTRIFYLFEEKCGPTQLEMLIDGLESSIGRLEKVVAKAGDVVSEIPPQKRFFFNNNLRYQAHYLLRLSKSLYHMAKTMEARPRSDYHDKQEVFISHMEAALEHFTAARALLDKTETGPFEGWYNTYDKRYPFEELTRSIEEVKTYFINHRF